MVVVAERNTSPDAIISAYKIVHAMGKTQLGGVRGDWLRDLYQRESVMSVEIDETDVFIYV
jgi:hypothetical protein